LTIHAADPESRLVSAWALTRLGHQNAEDLPDIAAAALADGVNTPTLIDLAGRSRSDQPDELRELLGQISNELGKPLDLVDARLWLFYMWCAQALEGLLDVDTASQSIFSVVYLSIDEIVAARPDFPAALVDDLIGPFLAKEDGHPDIDEYRARFQSAARKVVDTFESG
jgi:hypothetical protein